MRNPAPGHIIQDIPIRATIIMMARVETLPGADTQKILDAVGPELLTRVRSIPCVADVSWITIEEVIPKMASGRDQ